MKRLVLNLFCLAPVTLLLGCAYVWLMTYEFAWRVERRQAAVAATAPDAPTADTDRPLATPYGRRQTVSFGLGRVFLTLDESAPFAGAAGLALGPAEYASSGDSLDSVPDPEAAATVVAPGFPGSGGYGGNITSRRVERNGFSFARFESGPRTAQEAKAFGNRAPPHHEQRTYAAPLWVPTAVFGFLSLCVLVVLVIRHRPPRRPVYVPCRNCGRALHPKEDRCLVCSEPRRSTRAAALVR